MGDFDDDAVLFVRTEKNATRWTMAPKPFPYPLHVGIDVCNVSRLAAGQRGPRFRNLWARKVFTRLEWPRLYERYQVTRHSLFKNAQRQVSKEIHNQDAISPWKLPSIPSELIEPSSPDDDASDKSNRFSPPFMNLVRHLAGRWAAKEAVIKAYSHRPLYMREISIVHDPSIPSLHPAEFGKEKRLVALIDPPTDTILMDENVAKMRGLRGFGPENDFPQPERLLLNGESDISLRSKTTGDQNREFLTIEDGKKSTYQKRRAKVDESQRQVAEINISHDSNTAVAVCIAAVESGPVKEPKLIVDDGSSPPMHEPQWGDQGFLQIFDIRRLDLTRLAKENDSGEDPNI